ncbi:MAG TPA: MMPL family transporter, partial [Solirubrobacteraceae bacterium]|nr:MMPL family transporter [Solirubrobacteraceae bacterium]
MADRFARLVVAARVPIVVAWIVAAAALTLLLPSIHEAQVGALGDLVPAGADAIETEERAASLFLFPFLSRTIVVARDPDGLTLGDQARVAVEVAQLDRGELPALRQTRGYVLSNGVGDVPLVRERSTTLLTPLLFAPGVGRNGRNGAAVRFAEQYVRPSVGDEAYVGVTGAIPARAAQAEVIDEHLPLFEVATLLFVLGAVGLYFRALLAPLVNLAAVAIAYLVCVRLVATIGAALGVSVPSEVEPVIVALLFGVVTDYSLFFLSRFRRRLDSGEEPDAAARATTAELTPIILTCGLAVAAACSALVVARLGFLQAFGPGLALAVLIGMAVTMTFVPAALALLGRRLFWPHRPAAGAADPEAADGIMARIIGAAVRRPRTAIVATLLVLAAMAAPIATINLGNPLIRGLPSDSEPRRAYAQASAGLVPGVLSPTVLVVEGPGVTQRRDALSRLQDLLAGQPGVAEVLGPAFNPTDRELGAVLARNGNAARYVIAFTSDPLGSVSIERLAALRERIDGLLARAGLAQARASFAGDTALSQETIENTVADLWRVVPAVLLAVLLVLVVFLRGLVAPLYLVALAALAPVAAIGLGVGLFELLLEQEMAYYVPVAAGVLLVALGSDYNILLVGRVWHEARLRPLREATIVAGAGAARAISAAGIVLAVSFAALALVPLLAFAQLAFVMATGLLIDAFLVRTVLVPAAISVAGYRSEWPGRRLRRQSARARRTVAPDPMPAAPQPAVARSIPPGAPGPPRPRG